MGQEQQIALFMPILEGVDGKEKMSKSLGNYIGISEPAEVMFKKVMEIPDDMIIKYYELATDVHPDEIENIKLELASGANPRDIKLRLAKMITALYHTPGDEEKAVKYYDMAFSKKTIPDDIPTMVIEMDKDKVYDVLPQLIDMGFIKSKSEFIRLARQEGVQINREKIKEDDLNRILNNGDVIKIGKKRFVRIIKN
jgi:tyrosyl-tRNA synthetase